MYAIAVKCADWEKRMGINQMPGVWKILLENASNTCSVNSDVEYGLESCIDWIEIKAWMPLPEPYKEG